MNLTHFRNQSAAILVGLAASVMCSGMAAAQSPAEKGLEIAREVDRRDLGWKTSETMLNMTLRNRHGQSSTRDLRIQSLEVEDPDLGDESLILFFSPRDIDGTAFLTHTRITEPDDQWLYLPALKRVKRISSANKSGPFVGSEFAYEDMSSQEVNKYTYKWLRDEMLGDDACFVVERYPVYKNSGYIRHIVWIDKAEYRPMKVEFYDRKDSLLKTLTLTDYTIYQDQYWRSHTLTMENHQTGKSTVLSFGEYKFDIGVNEATFTSARLTRVR